MSVPVRLLKILLVLCVGFQALFYAMQNLVNIDAAYDAVALVLGMEGHEVYPRHFAAPVTWPPLVALALALVVLGEMISAMLCLKGAIDMGRRLRDPAARFEGSKQWAVLGCGVAVIVWLGLFMAIGGAWFQMWQTELGAGSLEGAFMYAVSSAIVMIFVHMPDA
ncbi:MAG: DUF2165 family protein [Wenzhouxiangellaceae bacterium]|nr:DUF2165 family protein [Wenzhouxiangellaceae bacterium]